MYVHLHTDLYLREVTGKKLYNSINFTATLVNCGSICCASSSSTVQADLICLSISDRNVSILTESVLPEFDWYRAIYNFSNLQ
jgi:hypothetical protein